MASGPNMGGLSRKHVVQGCEASLKRLGVETIDLYQIHRFDHAVPLDETLAALDLLVRQGKVRYHRRELEVRRGVSRRRSRSPSAKGWARFASHAEPLQPSLPRGGARDASAVRGRTASR